MVIALICIPITALVVGFLVLKSVQIGLRWQIETKQDKPPTLETNVLKPLTEAVQERRQVEQLKEQDNIFSEWLHGEG